MFKKLKISTPSKKKKLNMISMNKKMFKIYVEK